MKTQISRLIALAAVTAGIGLSTNAHAVWTFENSTITAAGEVANRGATNGAAGDPTVSLSGISVANTNGVVSGSWAKASLNNQGSLGVGMTSNSTYDPGQPNHALDNSYYTEGVLLNFSSSIVLSSIGLGYTSDGTCRANSGGAVVATTTPGQCPANSYAVSNVAVDLSVFRWTGAGTPGGSPVGLAANVAMAGWELVGNYGNMNQDNSDPYNLVNAGGKGSSWWLISAYNSGFAQSAGRVQATGETFDNGNDYFKLLAVAGTQCSGAGKDCGGTTVKKLPEPATLALTSVALLGVAGLRRRSKAKAV